MPTILPLAPSATLAPGSALKPEGETIYTDAPLGQIGGTLVVGGGGMVKVGGTSVNQQPQRQPRTYPQQAPPRLIHIEYHVAHDAPTGQLSLSGSISEELVESLEYAASRYAGDPTIQDVLAAQRHARRIIRQKVGT